MTVYYTISGVTVRYSAYYGQGSGPIWLRNVLCKGTEQRLLHCNTYYPIYSSSCTSHAYDVGVVCPSKFSYSAYTLKS